jgi:hypothetical protein
VEKVEIPLKKRDGVLDVARVALHPERTVDVAAVRTDDVVMAHMNRIRTRMTSKVLLMDRLIAFADLPGSYGHIGQQVFALGYPHGITSVLTNYPIAKVGHLAATAGEELALSTKWLRRDGKESAVTVRGKLILVDGLLVPGNSGGPVVLPGSGLWDINPKTGETVMQTGGSTMVLGIVSAGWAPAGLTYAYATDYIKDVIGSLLSQMKSQVQSAQ